MRIIFSFSSYYVIIICLTLSLLTCVWSPTCALKHYSKERKLELREEARRMFQHAYDGYLRYASDYDELRPLTCDGVDTWGSYSLTLIDALDTLAIMGNHTEFRRVVNLLENKMNFDKDINVSVFETNIRIVGGLLSAHLLSKRAGVTLESGWPCQGPLLRMAENVAKRLLPAFDTATGMPYGTVNLMYGVPKDETSITCTAGVGTLLVEFGTLTRLTGNPIYEEVALNALYSLWKRRSSVGLFGNHIDVQTGRWTAVDSGIGAGVDSFFEYLVKGAILLQRPELLEMFHEAHSAIDKYLRHGDWYVWASMTKGQITLPVFQSLESFWPGLLSLIGDIGPAIKTISKYASVWRKYGFLPEFYNIPTGEASVSRESYPLRPELVESAMYLYRATKNDFMLEIGEDMLRTIEHSAKTKCGYATIRNVITHEKANRMESFFLAETTKYLYLLFDEDNFLHSSGAAGDILETNHGQCVINSGPYVFNTEAHPIDLSALYCCHDLKHDIFESLDLEQFSEASLVQKDQELTNKKKYAKYDCPNKGNNQKSTKSLNYQQTLSVDIVIYDENNNLAADALIKNFEQIKNASVLVNKNGLKQLTVRDLFEFFSMRKPNLSKPIEILNYINEFLQNYTLEPALVKNLGMFDKNISRILGSSSVHKEFEGTFKTLWQLYSIQQEYAVNDRLLRDLNLETLGEDDKETIEKTLLVLNGHETNESCLSIRDKVEELTLLYRRSLVNTTAMQEFLFRLLLNGTNEKIDSFKPMLSDSEIVELPLKNMSHAEQLSLFSHVRRFLEFKKRMIDTFQRLQSLIVESNKQQKISDEKEKSFTDTNPTEVRVSVKRDDKFKSSQEALHELNLNYKLASNVTDGVDEGHYSNSMWSRFVQTILRKTNPYKQKFQMEQLLRKTRQSLIQYIDNNVNFGLITCSKEKFIERFAYRDFYP
uniref:alpha-1,2-Mannosidase n=1 Tax=Glossina palpalis gambiensis TaxID=67801 RepID=A0A1B0B9Q8_9MUSC